MRTACAFGCPAAGLRPTLTGTDKSETKSPLDPNLKALESEDFNVTRAARRLGISRKSLQTKMKDYGLREDPRAGRS